MTNVFSSCATILRKLLLEWKTTWDHKFPNFYINIVFLLVWGNVLYFFNWKKVNQIEEVVLNK